MNISYIWPDVTIVAQTDVEGLGTVYKAHRNGVSFNLRVFDIYSKDQLDSLTAELETLVGAKDHKGILRYEEYKVVAKADYSGWEAYVLTEDAVTLADKFYVSQMDEAEIIKVGKDICAGLDTCSAFNIVHRNINPWNIYFSSDGEYKLGDLGTSGLLSPFAEATDYMSPEIYRREGFDESSPVYSLGLVLYQLSNGGLLPFADVSQSNDESVSKRLGGEPLPPPKNASPALAEVIVNACAFDKNGRFINSKVLGLVLGSLAEGAGVVEPVAAPLSTEEPTVAIPPVRREEPAAAPVFVPTPHASSYTPEPQSQAPSYDPIPYYHEEPKKKTGLIIALVILVLLLIGGGVFAFFWFGDTDDDEEKIDKESKGESVESDSYESAESKPYESTDSSYVSEDSEQGYVSDYNSEYVEDESSVPTQETEEPYESSEEAVDLYRVSVVSLPDRLEYAVGDAFDPTGMILKLSYSDGSTTTVSEGFTWEPELFSVSGNQTVTIDYEGKTTTFTVKVIEETAAEDYIYEGSWGALDWGIDADGTLVISGSGAMDDLSWFEEHAWAVHKAEVSSIVVEEGVTTLGDYAFVSFHNLKSVSLPNSLRTIGVNSFRDCNALTELALPAGITWIKEDAFAFCVKLKTINIPIGVTEIEDWLFGYCYALTTIDYEGTVSQWQSMTKGLNWDLDTPDYTVRCSDGFVTK